MFPVEALSRVFRARFTAGLRKEFRDESKEFFESLFKTNWVLYAKQPFGGPLQVIEYLGRYTHKIAISNHRINAVEKDTVRFAYRDYRQSGNCKEMTLAALEFIRRFALHILPKRFVRIRHYGILSSKVKGEAIPIIRTQLNPWLPEESVDREATTAVAAIAMPTCPCCKKGVMLYLMCIRPFHQDISLCHFLGFNVSEYIIV